MNTPLDNPTTRISVEVNGSLLTRDVECRKHLVDFLREDCGLKGSHLGCEHGVCGACTVRLDGRIVRGCLVLAAQASGHRVETVAEIAICRPNGCPAWIWRPPSRPPPWKARRW